MEFENVRLEKDGRFAWVTFTRERSLNAMSNAASAQFHRVAMALREESDIRVVVVRGRGERAHFSRDAEEARRAYLEKRNPVWG